MYLRNPSPAKKSRAREFAPYSLNTPAIVNDMPTTTFNLHFYSLRLFYPISASII